MNKIRLALLMGGDSEKSEKEEAVSNAGLDDAAKQEVFSLAELPNAEAQKEAREILDLDELKDGAAQSAKHTLTLGSELTWKEAKKKVIALKGAEGKPQPPAENEADAEAEAIRKKAEAEAEAERQRALGEKAKAMVPVEVQRAQVDVDRDRVETVIKPELEAREKHGAVAQEFEIAKLRVAADKEVQVAFAEASAKLFSKLEATLYGTADDMTRIMESVVKGQRFAKTLEGFTDAADPETLGMLRSLASKALGKGSDLLSPPTAAADESGAHEVATDDDSSSPESPKAA